MLGRHRRFRTGRLNACAEARISKVRSFMGKGVEEVGFAQLVDTCDFAQNSEYCNPFIIFNTFNFPLPCSLSNIYNPRGMQVAENVDDFINLSINYR